MKGRRSGRISAPLIAALLCAAAWGALWRIAARPSAPSARNRAPASEARVLYRPMLVADRDAGDGELRAVWSPVLFSLPTPYGFSRPLLEERGAVPPPLSAGSLAAFPLPFSTHRHDKPPRLRLGATLADALQRIPQPREAALHYAPTAVMEAQPVRLEFRGPFKAEDFTWAALPDSLAGSLPRLAMDVALSIGTDGLVRHALIERGSGQLHIDRLVLDALYRWRMPPPGRELQGAVLIRILKAAPAPAAAGEAS